MPTLVEKAILVEHKVEDLWGLLMDLRRASFKVKNVGSDPRGTYVYLELDEEKDPAPIVEAWVGKPSPQPSLLLRDLRVKELKKVEAEEEVRLQAQFEAERKLEEARSRGEEQIVDGQKTLEEINAENEVPAEKVGFLKRIFRKFF